MSEHQSTSSVKFSPQQIESAPDVIDEEFFRHPNGSLSIVTAQDLEQIAPIEELGELVELDRYWLNFPYAYASICKSELSNELRYFVVEPTLSDVEHNMVDFLMSRIPGMVRYTDDKFGGSNTGTSRAEIREQVFEILHNFGLNDLDHLGKAYQQTDIGSDWSPPGNVVTDLVNRFIGSEGDEDETVAHESFDGADARQYGAEVETDYLPLDTPLESHPSRGDHSIGGSQNEGELGGDGQSVESVTFSDYQIYKILYYIERNFLGYQRIDSLKYDVNIEDITCNGHREPVFVYHASYGQIMTNIVHEKEELNSFVARLAQDASTEISRREPQADIVLDDGSRGQITLGDDVSGKGTNYTIRQFKDIPHTPIDLLNWGTYSLGQMALMWLAVEYDRSLLIAGGAASGKTTTVNALGLFIPGNEKVVTIEDTRELKLPQQNWTQSITRESVGDDTEDVTVFDHLRAALRQRPDYLLLGEVRGEEGKDLFQIMSTGHTTFSTFHADNVDEVVKRMTTEPINVSKSVFSTLDLISINQQTVVDGENVRRNRSIAEVTGYSPERDSLAVDYLYRWESQSDAHRSQGESETLNELREDMGWSRERLRDEIQKREFVLAYLVANDIRMYHNVAPVLQGFMLDNGMMLRLMEQGFVEESFDELRNLKTIDVEVDIAGERTIPRPEPSSQLRDECQEVLDRAGEILESSGVQPVTDDELTEDVDDMIDDSNDLDDSDDDREETSPDSGAVSN